MEHDLDPPHHLGYRRVVTDVGNDDVGGGGEVLGLPVREIVQYLHVVPVDEESVDEMGPDEPGPAGYESAHTRLRSMISS
jgi:hypothetical protein